MIVIHYFCLLHELEKLTHVIYVNEISKIVNKHVSNILGRNISDVPIGYIVNVTNASTDHSVTINIDTEQYNLSDMRKRQLQIDINFDCNNINTQQHCNDYSLDSFTANVTIRGRQKPIAVNAFLVGNYENNITFKTWINHHNHTYSRYKICPEYIRLSDDPPIDNEEGARKMAQKAFGCKLILDHLDGDIIMRPKNGVDINIQRFIKNAGSVSTSIDDN